MNKKLWRLASHQFEVCCERITQFVVGLRLWIAAYYLLFKKLSSFCKLACG
ncbi:hypothetical protein AAHH88_00370 [Candidatus Hodgkinia cicadicola]